MQTWICPETSVLRFLFWDFCSETSVRFCQLCLLPCTLCQRQGALCAAPTGNTWARSTGVTPWTTTPQGWPRLVPDLTHAREGSAPPGRRRELHPAPRSITPEGFMTPQWVTALRKAAPGDRWAPPGSAPRGPDGQHITPGHALFRFRSIPCVLLCTGSS